MLKHEMREVTLRNDVRSHCSKFCHNCKINLTCLLALALFL